MGTRDPRRARLRIAMFFQECALVECVADDAAAQPRADTDRLPQAL
ncbi:MAG: hypothetical protein ACK4IA_15475 [Paracoccus hibiscisoli]